MIDYFLIADDIGCRSGFAVPGHCFAARWASPAPPRIELLTMKEDFLPFILDKCIARIRHYAYWPVNFKLSADNALLPAQSTVELHAISPAVYFAISHATSRAPASRRISPCQCRWRVGASSSRLGDDYHSHRCSSLMISRCRPQAPMTRVTTHGHQDEFSAFGS